MRASIRSLLPILLAACGGGSAAGTAANGVLEVPECLDFGVVPLGASAERPLVLVNAGAGDLVVDAVEVGAPFAGGGLPATVAPGATLQVPVRFAAVEAGPVGAVARIRTGREVREVRLAAIGGPSPLRCTPGAVDLGRPVVGTGRSFRIECANRSAAAVEVRVEPEGARDVTGLPAGPLPVPAGDRLALELGYRPAAATPLAARLRFVSGAATLGEVAVTARPIETAVVVPSAAACPGGFDVGFAPPGTTAFRTLGLANAGDRFLRGTVVAVEGPFAVEPTGSFEIPIDDPATGAHEGGIDLGVTFAPATAGPATGRVELSFDDPVIPTVTLCLSGFGGGPVLSCSPEGLDFGPVVVGAPRTETVTCRNAGSDVPGTDDDRLTIDWAWARGAGFTAEAALPEDLRPGQSFPVAVTFSPPEAGPASGSLEVAGNDTLPPPNASLPLQGTGLALGPCAYRVEPPALDFGPVAAGGAPATLPVTVHNDGADRCLVRDLGLSSGTDASFSLPEGPVDAVELAPGGALVVPVRFAPTVGAAPAAGGLAFGISSPAAPTRTVPLASPGPGHERLWPGPGADALRAHRSGVGAALLPLRGSTAPSDSCLEVFPERIDFGEVAPGCTSLVAELVLIDTCGERSETFPHPLRPFGTLAWQGAAAPFRVSAPPASHPAWTPLRLQVEYRPTEAGEHLAGLRWSTAEGGPGRLVPIRGRAATPSGVEVFPPAPPRVDVLFVMDNSGGMAEEQAAASNSLPSLLAVAGELGVDWRFGVTTTSLTGGSNCPGGAGGGEDGRLFPVNGSRPRVVRSSMADAATLAAANLVVGDCHHDEQGLEAAHRGLTPPVIDHADDPRHPEPGDGNFGFLRADARLAVIALTDEADHSPHPSWFYAAAMGGARRAEWREPRFSGHAITGDRGTGCSISGTGVAEAGDELIAWSEASGGHFMSICMNSWAPDFARLGRAIFGRTWFPLKGRPAGTISPTTADLRIVVDGRPWDAFPTDWRWDAAANAVVFDPEAAPDPDARVEFHYTPVCVPPAP